MNRRKIPLLIMLSASLLALVPFARGGETMTDKSMAPPAQPAPLPPLSLDSWWNGPSMTYDWFGQGATMRSNGVYLEMDLTQFGQGLVSGNGNHAFEYGSKTDAFLHFEGEQAGTWKGFSLDAHAEYLYGDNALSHGGIVSPINTALLVPKAGEDILTLSSFFLTQKLGDVFSIAAGRFNTIDFTVVSPYDGGRGITGFWNTSLLAPMVEIKSMPPVTNGVMLTANPVKDLAITLAFFDPHDSSTTTGLPNLYGDGVTILSSVKVTTHFFDLNGSQALTGIWDTQRSTALGQLQQLVLPQFFGTPSTKDNTWALAYHFDQAIYQLKDSPKESVGLFGSAGISDGNPNPIKYSATFGIGGNSPIPGREDDRLGVGYYYLGLSDAITNQQFFASRLRNEQGTEMFYTAAINKWWEVTADLQLVDPASTKNDTNVVLGLSTKIKF